MKKLILDDSVFVGHGIDKVTGAVLLFFIQDEHGEHGRYSEKYKAGQEINAEKDVEVCIEISGLKSWYVLMERIALIGNELIMNEQGKVYIENMDKLLAEKDKEIARLKEERAQGHMSGVEEFCSTCIHYNIEKDECKMGYWRIATESDLFGTGAVGCFYYKGINRIIEQEV